MGIVGNVAPSSSWLYPGWGSGEGRRGVGARWKRWLGWWEGGVRWGRGGRGEGGVGWGRGGREDEERGRGGSLS